MPQSWLLVQNKDIVRIRAACLAAFAGLVLAGCGEFKSATEYLIAGNEAFKRNNYKQAEIEYRNALRLEPESSTALNNLGVILNELGNNDDAIAILSKATKIDPKNIIAHYTLSQAQTKKGLYEEAIVNARRAIDLSTDDLGGHRALALASLMKAKRDSNQEDLKIAIAEYRTILQSESDDDATHHHLAEALELSGDATGALIEGKKAVQDNPDNLVARKLVARLMIDSGDKDGASAELKTVIEKDPSDAEARKLQSSLGEAP